MRGLPSLELLRGETAVYLPGIVDADLNYSIIQFLNKKFDQANSNNINKVNGANEDIKFRLLGEDPLSSLFLTWLNKKFLAKVRKWLVP